jgi:hypothetical protein
MLLIGIAVHINLVSYKHHLGVFSLGEAQGIPLVDEVIKGGRVGLIED